MAFSSDTAAMLTEAISKVYNIKSCVSTALHLCPDVPDLGPAAASSALECMERAQQQLLQLQQLAPHIQQVATSVSQQQQQQQALQQPAACNQPAQQQPATPVDSWISAVQQQAATAAATLQEQVQAAVCSSCGVGPALQPPRPQQRQHYDHHEMLHTLQYVSSVVPHVQLHLFKSSGNQLHCSIPWTHRSTTLEQQLAKCSPWTDEVRLVCPGVFVASIALACSGSLEPLRVCVDNWDQASSVDAWTSSKHQVFKRISNLAVRALLHFQRIQQAHSLLDSPSPAAAAAVAAGHSSGGAPAAGVALTCLLLWLSSYDDLFSKPCDVSGKLIAWEPATAIPLPPVLRPYWLSLEQLTEAARDRSKRRAYHIHHAPWPPTEHQTAAATSTAQQQQDAMLPGQGSAVSSEQVAAAVTDEQLLQHMQTVMVQ